MTNPSSVIAALTDTSPASKITLALVSNLGDDYLLTKETSISSTMNNDVLELNMGGEPLFALKECVHPIHREPGIPQLQCQKVNKTYVPTYADSAVNKHCLINCSDFTTYHALSRPDEGQPANKGGQFCIIGHGSVTKTIVSGSLKMMITFKHAVHTPGLITNLISISKLDGANCWVLFGGGGVTFYDLHGGQKRTLMKGAGSNGMYLLRVEPKTPTTCAFIAHSLAKPTSLEVWHRCFGHVGTLLHILNISQQM